MAKEYDFKVVDVDTISTFEAEVKRLLAEGYELHGGVVAFQGANGAAHYIQALVKDVAERRSTGFSIRR